ncbi:FAD-binding protein [Alphaproteobacteria bacterium]|jgi:D-lactate dehydrogenase (cytochrome)|nr:FAD-binding protein [Alphaproteobacteria bacterium]MDB9871942.1 FAD-binding protein [Alphaproteobacteria bacterium]|tara:strand:+ start:9463 stop:10875 length:1413 start_codon:yes stop_codon:yes gene_type:complete
MHDEISLWSENDYDKESIRLCVEKIKNEFGQQFSNSKSILEQHTHTMTIHDSELPDGVVFVESKEDVQKVVKICNEYKCPIIPFGIGSSFEGHVNAPYGGISIDMNNMNKILNVYQEDLLVVVQPGVTREQLNIHLRDTGLFFPIDPGANASIGGMAATRASGTNAVKYGTMKDNVIALEVVTADGQLIKTANKARKSSAGYDLTRLMVGSEGTLGISTEITLKLYGIPEVIAGGRVSFPSVKDATDAVIMTIQSGIPVARIEFLDLAQVKAINNYSKTNLPESPLLLLEFHGSESSVKEQSELFGEIASDFGGNDFEWTSNNEERSKLWQARHDAYWSCKAVRPEADIYSTDVCVPISRLSDCMIETIEDMEKNDLIGPIVSHAGDGNFHVALLIDKNSKEELKKLDTFLTRISERAIRMDGTCTGEHGIGQGKRKYMLKELGSAVNVMKQVKMAFDPYKIMNPGKLFL